MPTYEEQRDTIIPRKAVVEVPPSDGLPQGETIQMPRLTLRRSLMLSRWIDDVSQDPNVKDKLVEFATSAGEDTSGLGMIFGVNSLISQLAEEKVVEFFCILTGKSEEFIENFWEPGWGFQAIKVAFQQQGFGKMFQAPAENSNPEDVPSNISGETDERPLEQQTNVVSMPSST